MSCSKEEEPVVIDPPVDPEEQVDPYFLEVIGRDELSRAAFAERLDLGASNPLILALPEKKIVVESIKYRTLDPAEETVAASGIIAYPADKIFKGVVVSEHYTIGANAEAPSSVMASIESALALFGYLVITPDYLGFGTTRDLPQPYLHARTAGQTSVDMVFAVREYMDSIGLNINTTPLTVIGYSQGAHSAFAFARMAEEEYAEEMTIKQVFAGGGPYEPAAMFDFMLQQEQLANPATILLTVIGLDYAEQLDLNYTELFTESIATGCRSWCINKDYTLGQINRLMATDRLTEIIRPEILFSSSDNELHKVMNALERNGLTDWAPKAPLLLVHGTKDRTVPFLNAEIASKAFKAAGSTVELITFDTDHSETAPYFYLLVLQRLAF
ncbi:alpha/beta hydrolase [Parabacteroides sp. PF5-6]|uniref:alpha/beta hydrolase n=1 Tax=Parabacteroides sp. PF5-6 TaxID=1742403 RepID=UPI0024076A1C|nr:alpha/beta hydrolase [Parabacteroides sp. PF5-6]